MYVRCKHFKAQRIVVWWTLIISSSSRLVILLSSWSAWRWSLLQLIYCSEKFLETSNLRSCIWFLYTSTVFWKYTLGAKRWHIFQWHLIPQTLYQTWKKTTKLVMWHIDFRHWLYTQIYNMTAAATFCENFFNIQAESYNHFVFSAKEWLIYYWTKN